VSARQRTALFLIAIIFVAFISLGLPDGLLDIANPRIRGTFGIGPDVFSLLFLSGVTGYSVSSFFAGQLVTHMGIALLLSASCLVTASALIGDALSPGWGWFVLLGLMGGAGAGAIDTGLNTYVATHHSPRLMFWLHASFGLGVTSGTWIMSLVVNSGQSWRLGYAIVGGMQIGLALVILLTRARWPQPESQTVQTTEQPSEQENKPPIRVTLRIPVVWLGIALFFLYTGVEITTGRWASSLFIEGRHIKPETAGLWVSAYWGMFTIGRVVAGFVRGVTPIMFLRLSMIGAVIAAALLVWKPANWTSGLAIGLLGIAFAPIFPMLVSATPGRVGSTHAPNAIGFEIAAAGIGGLVIPSLTGILAKTVSIDTMPVLILIVTTTVFVLHEAVLRFPPFPQAAASAAPILETSAADR
jgi:fucose permease